VSFREELNKNLKTLAKEQGHTIETWYRRKYHLPITDSRYLNLEYWQMELEYEIEQFIEEETEKLRNFCPKCGTIVYGNFCSICNQNLPTERYFDPDFDEYFDAVEKECEDFTTMMKDDKNWEEVKA